MWTPGRGAITGFPVAGRVNGPINHMRLARFWGCAFTRVQQKRTAAILLEVPLNLFFICLCPGFASLVQARDQRDSSYPVDGRPSDAVEAQRRIALFEQSCATRATIAILQALLAAMLGNHHRTRRKKIRRRAAQ